MINIPDERSCRKLMARSAMLPNIEEHSFRVCQVAVFLGKALNIYGAGLNIELIQAASLLHDITKTRSLQTKELHAETGKTLLESLGYPEVGEIIGHHVELKEAHNFSALSEVHIVNHADRRVLHEKVVSLEKRFAYLMERYGRTDKIRALLKNMEKTALHLEKIIFTRINIPPDEITAFNTLAASDWKTIPASLNCYLESSHK